MGIRAVENFDSTFELSDECRSTLTALLSSDTFCQQVIVKLNELCYMLRSRRIPAVCVSSMIVHATVRLPCMLIVPFAAQHPDPCRHL